MLVSGVGVVGVQTIGGVVDVASSPCVATSLSLSLSLSQRPPRPTEKRERERCVYYHAVFEYTFNPKSPKDEILQSRFYIF